MRPPICAVCDGDVDPRGGLVTFRRDAAADDFRRRAAEEPGFVGHPPEQEWFCAAHREAAEALTHLTAGEALGALRRSS